MSLIILITCILGLSSVTFADPVLLDANKLYLENEPPGCANVAFVGHFENKKEYPYLLAALKRCSPPEEAQEQLKTLNQLFDEFAPKLIKAVLGDAESFEKTYRPLWVAFINYINKYSAEVNLREVLSKFIIENLVPENCNEKSDVDSIRFKLLMDLFILTANPMADLENHLAQCLTPKAEHYLKMIVLAMNKGDQIKLANFGRQVTGDPEVFKGEEYQVGKYRQEFIQRMFQLLRVSRFAEILDYFAYTSQTIFDKYSIKVENPIIHNIVLSIPPGYKGVSDQAEGEEINHFDDLIIRLAETINLGKVVDKALDNINKYAKGGLCQSLTGKQMRQKLAILYSIIPDSHIPLAKIKKLSSQCTIASEPFEFDKKWKDIFLEDDLRDLGSMDPTEQIIGHILTLIDQNDLEKAKEAAKKLNNPTNMAKFYQRIIKPEHFPLAIEVILKLKEQDPGIYKESANSEAFRSFLLKLASSPRRPALDKLDALCILKDAVLCEGLVENTLKDCLFKIQDPKRLDDWKRQITPFYSWISSASTNCNIDKLWDCPQPYIKPTFRELFNVIRQFSPAEAPLGYKAIITWISDDMLKGNDLELSNDILEMLLHINEPNQLRRIKPMLVDGPSELNKYPSIGFVALLASYIEAAPKNTHFKLNNVTEIPIPSLKEERPTLADVCKSRCSKKLTDSPPIKDLKEMLETPVEATPISCNPPQGEEEVGVSDWFAFRLCSYINGIKIYPKIRSDFKEHFLKMVELMNAYDDFSDSGIENLEMAAQGLAPAKDAREILFEKLKARREK